MRFMMIMHPDPKAYDGDGLPDVESVEKMTVYNKALAAAGVLLSADGLHGPREGFRVRFAGGRATITDGPFSESKEVIGGYWIIQCRSREEAVEWARRIPGGERDMVEVRQLFDMDEFPQEVRDAAQL